jgi:phage terminase large subunit
MAAPERVTIPYSPRRVFLPYHESSKRWRVIVAHRRAGKTVATVNQLIRSALTCDKPNPRAAYVAPLYKQAKDVAWSYLKEFTRVIPGAEANESELRVDLPNGGRVRLYGADNPDGMRGIYLDDCVLDEFADMRPRVLPEIIRPALSDRRGSLTIIGTPRGHNDFYRHWQLAQDDPDWYGVMLRASETGLVAADELEAARKMMTPEQYEQEFECSFEAAIQGAYWGKEMAQAEREGRICEVPVDPELPVYTAWDLGVKDTTAIWFFQVLAGGVNVVDFYEANGVGAEHYAGVIKERAAAEGYRIGSCMVPHDAKVTEWGSGRTRVETLQRLGLKPELVPDHSLMDGIQAARLTIPMARFDRARCADGLEGLKQYRAEFDEERKVFKPKPLHDWASNPADAWRYLAMGWRVLRAAAPEPKRDVDAYIGQPDGTIRSHLTFREMVDRQKRRRLERE